MTNAMQCIKIYRHQGTWAFTDAKRGLRDEPFVAGIPMFIDFIIRNNDCDPRSGEYRITFSKNPFPTAVQRLVFDRDDMGGAWYYMQPVNKDYTNDIGGEGWLCPATLEYFEDFPRMIYVEITPV